MDYQKLIRDNYQDVSKAVKQYTNPTQVVILDDGETFEDANMDFYMPHNPSLKDPCILPKFEDNRQWRRYEKWIKVKCLPYPYPLAKLVYSIFDSTYDPKTKNQILKRKCNNPTCCQINHLYLADR